MLKPSHSGNANLHIMEHTTSPRDTFALHPESLVPGMLEAFDLVGVGLAILDASGRVVDSNRAVDEILAWRDGLEMTPGRSLRAKPLRGTSAQGLFEQLQAARHETGGDQTAMAILAVSRPSGKRPWTLVARFPDAPPQTGAGKRTLVFVVDPELSLTGMGGHLRSAYGLTGTETDLAVLLMQGNPLVECCQQMGIQRSTAASHLSQLFRKTQTRTQGQLVSLLFRRFGLLGNLPASRKPRAASDSGAPGSDDSSESFANSFVRR